MKAEVRVQDRFNGRLSALELGGDEAYGRLISAASLLGKPPEELAFEAACKELAARSGMTTSDAAIALRELDRAHLTPQT
ncbi:hypothetical protein [Dyella sp. AD56]|uniref:hypothetical protein n=1 Tax=Dyella sp. AD56 TaxID=1528744 RepID=UPI000C81A610|nr:hypothetical protein [Dyella sp. AD56]